MNWSAYEMLAKEIETHNVSRKMLNIGSCGLHIVHNAFRNSLEATEWKIAELLSAAYYERTCSRIHLPGAKILQQLLIPMSYL